LASGAGVVLAGEERRGGRERGCGAEVLGMEERKEGEDEEDDRKSFGKHCPVLGLLQFDQISSNEC
jgi:hypothetical protein